MKSIYRMKLLSDLGKKSSSSQVKKHSITSSTAKADLRQTILVIDDEPAVLEILSETLRLYGYSVLAAASVKEGIQLYVFKASGQVVLKSKP